MGKNQNVYDDEIFFEGYKGIRAQENNYNKLQEQPAIKSLLPDLKGKRILDLGCGYGDSCSYFIEKGAQKVVGIDISKKMLEVARKENSHENIEYLEKSMDDIENLSGKFDLVYSSLALHYMEDFEKLLMDINNLMRKDGEFIYSQEHPLSTAHRKGLRWTRGEDGMGIHYNLANYMKSGKRETTWFIDGVIKYHRTFSEIINTVNECGFQIEKILEPLPSEEDIKLIPKMVQDFHKPNFLILKLGKK
ncbi:MAG: methyltransferase domain-containing protein [Psychrilyobacter sp.]|uniref:class I SAM-dependent methyltransferase n=1 Tax=Psychrilyobacter sp. TaxID=2586924 RepID=UPI003C721F6F